METLTDYKLEFKGSNIIVRKDGKIIANVLGTIDRHHNALEAIFVNEGRKPNDWFVFKDNKVYLSCKNSLN